tara:strand:+ start:6985 stop:7359 length:375 start_codon:yes stop_codon:yes gene_type:complete
MPDVQVLSPKDRPARAPTDFLTSARPHLPEVERGRSTPSRMMTFSGAGLSDEKGASKNLFDEFAIAPYESARVKAPAARWLVHGEAFLISSNQFSLCGLMATRAPVFFRIQTLKEVCDEWIIFD